MRTRAPVLLPIRSLSRGGGDIDKVYPICVSSEAFLCKAPSACHADITDLLFLIPSEDQTTRFGIFGYPPSNKGRTLRMSHKKTKYTCIYVCYFKVGSGVHVVGK